MHPQLELLLELQDLHTQRRALHDEPLREVEAAVFELRPDEALVLLDAKILELAGRLDPGIQRRYRDLISTLDRAVAPVLNGVCYGCFVSIPTSRGGGMNQAVQTCESCGRFIYFLS